MRFLRLIGNHESCQFSYKNHLLYPFQIESLYLYLLCLSASLLCYIEIQNYSLIRSTSCSCSTCCFGLGFQLQNLQDFIQISGALIKHIFLLPSGHMQTWNIAKNTPCSQRIASGALHKRPFTRVRLASVGWEYNEGPRAIWGPLAG